MREFSPFHDEPPAPPERLPDSTPPEAQFVAGSSVDHGDVAASEEKPAVVEGQAEKADSGYRERVQGFIDKHRSLFATFARDVSLSFKVSNGFFIDLEKGEVNLDGSWFEKKGYTERQALWAVLHELSHFRDLAEDPEGTMKNFDRMRSQARTTGAVMMAKWEAKYGESDPEYVEGLKHRQEDPKHPDRAMNAVEQAAYKMHHVFGNIFDDVFVNSMVARRAPAFETATPGGDEVRNLYREKLFSSADYSKQPRHLQFLYTLLRGEMVPGEPIKVSDEVRSVLETPVAFQGKNYHLPELVRRFVKPAAKRDTRASQRHAVLRRTLEPLFLDLLRKDLEEWDPKKPPKREPQEQGDGEGSNGSDESAGDANPFADDYQDFNENSPDQMDDGQFEDWMEKRAEDAKKAEAQKSAADAAARKTPEQKAAEAAAAQDKAWSEKNGIAPEALSSFRTAESRVAPYLQDLAGLWDGIISGSSREVQRGLEGHFRTGSVLDIQQVVDEWPKLKQGRFDEVRVMERMVDKELLVKKPERIRVRLLADRSGSMTEDKRKVLEEVVVLLLSSVREFNAKLELTRSITKSALRADTQVIGFDSTAEVLKPLTGDADPDAEYADIVRSFGTLRGGGGTTSDHLALDMVADGLSPEDRERIKSGKLLDIVFETTDGGSDKAADARAGVDTLLSDGLVARAFQIGRVGEEERATFNSVWNDGRKAKLGQEVGENIQDLIPAIAEALKAQLKGVRL